MSRFSDTVHDERGYAVPGVSVYVYEWDYPSNTTGALSALTDDDLVTPLPNPLTTDEFGTFYFNADIGVKLIEFQFAGKLLYREQIILTPAGFYPGNDAALRADLAAPGGAALIANNGGGTVQDAMFVKGNATAVGGGNAQVNWQRQDASALIAPYGGLWGQPVTFDHAISKAFASGAAGAPQVAFFSAVKNTGSDADAVGHMAIGEVSATGKTVFGGNIIAYSSGGANNYKMTVLELDAQPQAGTTPTSVTGLAINAFTMTVPGPAIYIEGVFGGKWGTGLSIGNLSDTGAGIAPAGGNPRMGSLLDSGTAQYQVAAIKLNNTHKLLFYGTLGNQATAGGLYMDSSNFLHCIMGSAGFVVRNNGDTSSIFALTVSGGQGIADIQTAAGEYRINTQKVVGARGAAIPTLTVTATSGTLPTADGTVTIANAATPTVVELLEYCRELESKLETLLSRIRAATGHGLIA